MGSGWSGSAEDAENDEALYYAAAHGDADHVAALIEAAANVNHRQKDHELATPLMAAAEEGAVDCVEALVQCSSCDVSIADRWGLTACHYAAMRGNASCLTLIIQAGAPLEQQTQDGATPAHLAAEHGHADCLALLLDAGIDPGRRSKAGICVADAASGSDACLAVLAARSDGQPGPFDVDMLREVERVPLMATV